MEWLTLLYVPLTIVQQSFTSPTLGHQQNNIAIIQNRCENSPYSKPKLCLVFHFLDQVTTLNSFILQRKAVPLILNSYIDILCYMISNRLSRWHIYIFYKTHFLVYIYNFRNIPWIRQWLKSFKIHFKLQWSQQKDSPQFEQMLTWIHTINS